MAEESHLSTVADGPQQSEPPLTAAHPSRENPEASAPPPAAEVQPESHARGILRQAIEKVMEEIEHHEEEAKKHSQQATQLRKDLRESIAFLQAQGAKAVPTGHAGTAAGSSTTEKAKGGAAPSKPARAGTKKKHVGKKSKE
jgi:hypothetical protein